jgi:protein kinase C substrate 80K-H
MKGVFCVLVCVLVLAQSVLGAATGGVRGVAPENQATYAVSLESGSFSCLDGSATLDAGAVNDDYCDCGDGSDEPGTSACNAGLFYCANKGFKPKQVFKSRVNDGLRDCCDGSDEFVSGAFGDICDSVGAEMRQEGLATLKAAREGVQARAALIAAAPAKFQDLRVTLEESSQKVTSLDEELAALQLDLTAAEVVERQEKERLQDVEDEEHAAAEARRLLEGQPPPPPDLDEPKTMGKVTDRHTINQGGNPTAGRGPRITTSEENPYKGMDDEEISEAIMQKHYGTQDESVGDADDTDGVDDADAEEKEEGKEENFPYPKEYMPQTEEKKEEAEKFPYPKVRQCVCVCVLVLCLCMCVRVNGICMCCFVLCRSTCSTRRRLRTTRKSTRSCRRPWKPWSRTGKVTQT